METLTSAKQTRLSSIEKSIERHRNNMSNGGDKKYHTSQILALNKLASEIEKEIDSESIFKIVYEANVRENRASTFEVMAIDRKGAVLAALHTEKANTRLMRIFDEKGVELFGNH